MKQNGIKALVIHEHRMLLSLRDNIPTIPWPNTWDWLGGGMEENETPFEALKRELKEEISVVPSDITYIGMVLREDGSQKHRAVVRMSSDEVSRVLMGDEGQDLQWFTLDEALELALPDGFRGFLNANYDYLNVLLNAGVKANPGLFVL